MPLEVNLGNSDLNGLILVDTHVHYYPFCTFSEYFDSAYANTQVAAERLGSLHEFTSILCLLETETSHWYQDLLAIASSTKQIGGWQLEALDNHQLLQLIGDKGEEILLIPGQQLITSENLEILIIGPTNKIAHNFSAQFYIEEFSDTYLVVIPWGVGKWFGARGRVVSNLILQPTGYKFALGDNSGRASVWKYVPQFNQAYKMGINILAGSDPLPVVGQHKKVACYGSVITGPMQRQGLAGQLREKLLDTQTSNIKSYGHLDNLIHFIVSQLLLRLQPIK